MSVYPWILEKIGYTFFLLFPMSILTVAFLIALLLLKNPPAYLKVSLSYLKSIAPQVGLLGSVLGIALGLSGMELEGGREVLNRLVQLLGSAYFSTLYGISISLICSLAFIGGGEIDGK